MDPRMDVIKKLAESKAKNNSKPHDFSHIGRVYNLCMDIAEYEKDVNMTVLKVAALLHDIARRDEDNDHSGNTDHAIMGAKKARELLVRMSYPEDIVKRICDCIEQHRFRSENRPSTIEAKILFDADKLDSLGAIGVARSFYWAGEEKSRLYASEKSEDYAKQNLTGESTEGRIMNKSMHSPNIEFETKFRKIPERLYTRRAKEIALERMTFMEEFYTKLAKEYKGIV